MLVPMLCEDFKRDECIYKKETRKALEDLNGIALVGLCYNKKNNDMFIKECKATNRVHFKEIFQTLKCLKIGTFNHYLIMSIMLTLPPTLSSLNIKYNINGRGFYLKELFNKLDNLKEFKLTEFELKLEKYRYLTSKQLPKLQKLYIESMKIIEHRKLGLPYFNLSKLNVDNEIFPKSNQLNLMSCYNTSANALYTENNFIALKADGSILRADFLDFLDFLDTSCINLCDLEVIHRELDTALVVPILPSTITLLDAKSYFDNLGPSCKQLLNKFNNLKAFELHCGHFAFDMFFKDIYIEICISPNNYPKLKSLIRQGCLILMFDGASSLEESKLDGLDLSKQK
ncbi:hypothetical protein K502DRAFT_347475 [Neoconidiobolus thromboides FSU 785]|nr:hypothetical protein K502DRAFT_347475 [Neoconidiobolus thromboides FSU 785]